MLHWTYFDMIQPASLGSRDVSCVFKFVRFLQLSYEIQISHSKHQGSIGHMGSLLNSSWAKEAVPDNGYLYPTRWGESWPTSVRTESKNLEELLATEISRTTEKTLGDGWTELGLYARCFLYSNSSYWAATAVFLSESAVPKGSILCPNHCFLPHTMKKKVGSLCVSLSDEFDWLVWMLRLQMTHD